MLCLAHERANVRASALHMQEPLCYNIRRECKNLNPPTFMDFDFSIFTIYIYADASCEVTLKSLILKNKNGVQ